MSYYFSNDENLKSEIKKINVIIQNTPLSFYTDNGVFSKKGLDFATRSLLETLPNLKGDVLDLGCGYGPIGIYLKKINDISIDMIDINRRSLDLAKQNAELNKVSVNIFESDGYVNVSKKYDYIVTNPPIRVGKKTLYELLFKAKDFLKEKGQLWLVISKNQGAKSLVRDLNEVYQVEIVNKEKEFYIIKCQIN